MGSKHFASSTFRKTFMSYTAILIIPIIVFSVLNMHRNILEEQRKTNEKHVSDSKRIADVVDSKLTQLKSLSNMLSEQSWVQKLMQNTDVYDQEFDLVKLIEIRKDLTNAVNSLGILPFGAVVFPQKKLVISSWGKFAEDEFFTSVASFDEATREQLNDSFPNYEYFNILQPTAITLGAEKRRVIPVLQSLEVVNNPRASLLLFVDIVYLTDYMERFGGVEPNKISIRANDALVYQHDYIKVGSNQGSTYEVRVPSQVSDWQYTLTYPDKNVIGIQNLFSSLLAILISVVIGTASAFLLSIISYRPLQVLLNKLSGVVRKDDLGSEYKLIEKSFDRLIDENHSLQQAIKDYESAAKSNLLLRLLKGYFTEDQHRNGLQKFGLTYTEEKYYCTMLVSFHAMDDPSDLELMRRAEIVTIMVAETIMDRHQLHYELFEVTNADKAIIVSSSEPLGDERVKQISSEMAESIQRACNMLPEVLTGTVEKGLLGISKSYYAANESLQVKLFSRRGFRTDAVEETYINNHYYYPTDWEIQLINNLKIGNLETLTRILDEIHTENQKRQLPEAGRVQLVSRLMETMLRVLYELNIDAGIYARQFEIKANLENIDSMWSYVFEVGTLICERIRYSNSSSEMEAGSKLLLYVNQHYTSADMSLKKLAEMLEMSVPSVSRMFKEVTVSTSMIMYVVSEWKWLKSCFERKQVLKSLHTE
ncbi:AraC family transcriptional regulator [Paenibacillus herberti]|uniref:AraC family transcriptional regulator n=1 Tax=Paenibacillus herberti TaxID=1619309 RepID=UPI001FEC597E|nr:AraC family transcriptional regulator [Paenibacillus herberti]